MSHTLANLELQTGVKLFDRSQRYPRLTDAGNSLLREARLVMDGVDSLKARARAIEGLSARTQVLPMHAVYRKDTPPGPAGRALIDWLKDDEIVAHRHGPRRKSRLPDQIRAKRTRS